MSSHNTWGIPTRHLRTLQVQTCAVIIKNGDGQQYHQQNKKVEYVGYRPLIIEPTNIRRKSSREYNIN